MAPVLPLKHCFALLILCVGNMHIVYNMAVEVRGQFVKNRFSLSLMWVLGVKPRFN